MHHSEGEYLVNIANWRVCPDGVVMAGEDAGGGAGLCAHVLPQRICVFIRIGGEQPVRLGLY